MKYTGLLSFIILCYETYLNVTLIIPTSFNIRMKVYCFVHLDSQKKGRPTVSANSDISCCFCFM